MHSSPCLVNHLLRLCSRSAKHGNSLNYRRALAPRLSAVQHWRLGLRPRRRTCRTCGSRRAAVRRASALAPSKARAPAAACDPPPPSARCSARQRKCQAEGERLQCSIPCRSESTGPVSHSAWRRPQRAPPTPESAQVSISIPGVWRARERARVQSDTP